MQVDITFDIPCAWSFIGFTRLQRLAAEARAEGADVQVRFRPFQMDPDASVAGKLKAEVEREHFGPGFDREAAYANLNARGASEGVHFGGDAIWSNTFEAHRLLRVASRQRRGEEMAAVLFRAHHTDRKNVADVAVLRELAAQVGVTWSEDGTAETRAGLAKVRASGVRAIPVFAFDGGPVFNRVPGVAQLRQVLRTSVAS